MYEAFFGLQQAPFSIAPDPHYLYLSERHREALAHLLYGLGGGGGFVVLTGEIGAGKTTVCRCVMAQVPEHCHLAYIFNPKLTAPELLRSVCEEFGVAVATEASSVKDFVDPLNAFLLAAHAARQHCVLIIDEAQSLSAEALEQLRLLTNLETAERKLLQIVLVGQPELRSLLARPELESLAQRVIARYHLGALSAPETAAYIAHRLAVAGLKGPLPFEARVGAEVHRLTGGVPRRINLLCDRALLGAYGKAEARVSVATVRQAAREVFAEGLQERPPFPAAASWRQALTGKAGVSVLTVALAVALLSGLAAGVLGAHVVLAQREAAPLVLRPPAAVAMPVLSSAASSASLAPIDPAAAASTTPLVPTAAVLTPPAAPDLVGWAEVAADVPTAWRGLAERWRLQLPTDTEPCLAVQREGLRCHHPLVGSLALIRQIDRPVLLKVRPPGGASGWVLLTSLDTEAATLQLEGRAVRLPLGLLGEGWRGEFLTLWRPPTSPLPAERVQAFQAEQGLQPDGLAGPLTLMLFSRTLGTDEPRLGASP
jgi:general secretion pathway protein A